MMDCYNLHYDDVWGDLLWLQTYHNTSCSEDKISLPYTQFSYASDLSASSVGIVTGQRIFKLQWSDRLSS